MQQLSFVQGIEQMLDSLLGSRLVVLAGAGLSMAAPSLLPSAWTIAETARQKYELTHGATRAPLSESIEEQAQFFFDRGELATVYFGTLIDPHVFAGQPNEGHEAIADFLLAGGLQSAVTTNVDVLIETAGQSLLGQVEVGLDGLEVAGTPSPLLKIHGCRQRDRVNMVWAPGQLRSAPVAARIASSAAWMEQHWLNRDVLIVGYWTDWDYLNAVLENVLDRVRPTRVVVIDPQSSAQLRAKASALTTLGDTTQNGFHHVQISGADFLASLRKAFSNSFVRRVIGSGIDSFSDANGAVPGPDLIEPPDLGNHDLWSMRRDLAGCAPNAPATSMTPPNAPTVGLTILQLRQAGAVPDGPYWQLNGRRIRVLRTPDSFLHHVKASRARETSPATAPDIVIAVGAETVHLPSNIARAGTDSSIARGPSIRWLTRQEAVQELGL